MNFPDWDDYIRAPVGYDDFARGTAGVFSALAEQRENLKGFIEEYRPRRIGCLGSGYLLDIPIREFLREDGEVYLVDWIPSISVEGFKRGLIEQDADSGRLSCFICESLNSPEKYCSGFTGPLREPHQICQNFQPSAGEYLQCGNFFPGREPRFITADITQGVASQFGRQAAALVAAAEGPREAFERAIEECARCGAVRQELPIPSGSLDLATSSMVVSQFDHEPYGYFSKILEARFGRGEILGKGGTLTPLMERLRGELFRVQAEGHVRELHRLVRKEGGKVYFSVELFRNVPGSEDFFLVHEIPRAMDALGAYFHFDFRLIAPGGTIRRAETEDGASLIQNYVLSPKDI